MSLSQLKYVVVAPSFDENSGGTIFLHELVHNLNSIGEAAFLFPMDPIYKERLRSRFKNKFCRPAFKVNINLNTPVISKDRIDDNTFVVYPEIVKGNPLHAKYVARWLLYTPGKRHPFEFGKDEIYFKVDEFADLPEITGGATELFLWKVNKSYRNEKRPDREGSCFIVRKWKDGPQNPITDGAIQIDGMSHSEINEVFNRSKFFYSYDDATMYSQYAAVCGCISIVIPSGDNARDHMLSNHMLSKFGVAYGLGADKIKHARDTMSQVENLLLTREAEGKESVRRFIELTKSKFVE